MFNKNPPSRGPMGKSRSRTPVLPAIPLPMPQTATQLSRAGRYCRPRVDGTGALTHEVRLSDTRQVARHRAGAGHAPRVASR